MQRQFIEVPAGRLAYVDEGDGPPVVMVHGNPSSAHEYAAVVEALRASHRCIVPEHIGFGQSDKPADWDYLPVHHADNLARLLDTLDLRDATFVVGDWGGPIGLSWVLANPERVARVVIANTWLWSVHHDWYYRAFSWFAGGPIGRWLTTHRNFFARSVVRQAWGTHVPLTAERHAPFLAAHPRPDQRKGMWVFPQQIIGSSRWLAELWERREALRGLDLQLLWGMKDVAFRPDILARWCDAFPEAEVTRLPEVGHFVGLEAPEALIDRLAQPVRDRSTHTQAG